MEFREMMWELFISTGSLDAYLAYRACLCPDACKNATVDCGAGAYYQTDKPFGAKIAQAGGE